MHSMSCFSIADQMPRSGLLLGEQAPKAKDPESAFGTAGRQTSICLAPRELDPPGSNKIGLTTHEIESFRKRLLDQKRFCVERTVFTDS